MEINEKISLCNERETEISQILIELQGIVNIITLNHFYQNTKGFRQGIFRRRFWFWEQNEDD